MRKAVAEVFDAVIATTTTALTAETDPKYNEFLASCDKMSLQMIIDQPTTNVSGQTLAVGLWQSNDGRNWSLKTASIVSAIAAANGVVLGVGTDAGTVPTMALAKLVITSTLAVAGGNVHVKLLACLRDDG